MKITKKFQSYVVLILLAALSTGCGEDTPDPGTTDIPGEEISGTWSVVDPSDVTGPAADQFENFTLTVTATASEVSYVSTNNGDPIVFPDQGTIVVDATDNFEDGAEVLREPDNVPVTVNLSEGGEVLNLTFTIEVGTNARTSGINGEYNFRMEAQSGN